MLLIELMQLTTILNEVGLNQGFKFKLHVRHFKCHLFKLLYIADLSCSTCMEMVQMDRLDFSDHFFIYKLFDLELRLILYDF